MASNLQIIIKGGCSEPKNDLAKSFREFLLKRGYGTVSITESDHDEPYDGFLVEESVEIEVQD